MRLHVLDNEIRYECHSCADCCRQPWLAHVEEEKLGPIRDFDWGAKYPQLAGREAILMAEVNGCKVPMVAKKDNGECLFLDSDNLCIIHKELGYEAKPEICRRFPFYTASMPDAERVTANFACPSVQERVGPSMAEQEEDILATLTGSPQAKGQSSRVALLVGKLIPLDAAHALADRWATLFDPAGSGDLWSRFARAIQLATQAVQTEPDDLLAALGEEEFGSEAELPPRSTPSSLGEAPTPCRLLLALNLWNDYYPPNHTGADRPSLLKRMGLIGKVLHVVRMHGVYASRYLPGNIALHRLSTPAFFDAVPSDETSRLLCRWIRASFRQRTFRRDRISMLAGLHQQIVDTNSVHFYVRALADQDGRERPSEDDYRRALRIVGFGISFQQRAYQRVFRARAMAMLESLELARASLGMFCPSALAEGGSRTGLYGDHSVTH